MRFILSTLALLALIFNISFAEDGAMNNPQLQKATFAGGCFWCMQPFFDHTKGVKETVVGYTGGQTVNPTYEQVSSGKTGHAEGIQITFDPNEVGYERLVEIFLRNIDPTALNRQFFDEGTQYRTAIFYQDEEQKKIAEDGLKKLADSGKFNKPIVTQIVQASVFYPAEEYHQKYYTKNKIRYNMYHQGSGRDNFLEKIWGKE